MSGYVGSGTIFANLTWAIPITSIQSRPQNSTNPNKNTWFDARMKTHDYPPLFAEACWGYSHIHSAPLLLRFGAGRRGQLLMGPQSSGHLSEAHCYAIYAANVSPVMTRVAHLLKCIFWWVEALVASSGNEFKLIHMNQLKHSKM